MTDLALKQIKKVLQGELKPINKKLDEHDDQFKSINAKLDEHSVKLDSLTLDMINIQKKTDVLPDLHSYIKNTKEKVDELEERVDRLEAVS